MLDLNRLEIVRERSGKVIARCPACAEAGADRSGNHLSIFDQGRGRFACIAFAAQSGVDHRRRIFELAGISEGGAKSGPLLAKIVLPRTPPRRDLSLPPLSQPTIGELDAIAQIRGWHSFAGLELLSRRGLLGMADVADGGAYHRAWVISDGARRHAQARRLDGRPWSGIGGAKAKSLPGSVAAWPIGASEIGVRTRVVLCEGQPDFAAALLVAWWEGADVGDIAPVCMAGTGPAIHPEALALFTGKNVLIPQHNDQSEAGAIAAAKWAAQLYEAGAARVDGFDFAGITLGNGTSCKDLADYATVLVGDCGEDRVALAHSLRIFTVT